MSNDNNIDADRSALNIGNNRASSKKIALGIIFVFLSVLILLGGFYLFVVNNTGKDESNSNKNNDNELTAITEREVNKLDGNDFYNQAKAKNEERKKLEKARLERAERKRLAEIKAEKLKEIPEIKSNVPKVNRTPVPPQPLPTVPKPQPQPQHNGSKSDVVDPTARKLSKNVMVDYEGSQSTQESGIRHNESLDQKSFANGHALRRKEGSLDFTLIHGTSIPCSLYTQIISDYEGFVTCRVISDVYSANGATLLVERGSLVSGMQNVTLELGKARIFTSWSDIETPYGVSIKIDSLGTGLLGASGSEAWIDNHFMERFGGAIALSLVDDTLSFLGNTASENNSFTFDNSTDNAGDMAEQALESSIGIKPTGYSEIGQVINIMIVRDIDMSSVYKYEAL